jgi:hypothetical protein
VVDGSGIHADDGPEHVEGPRPCVGRWLVVEGLDVGQLDEQRMAAFLNARRTLGQRRVGGPRAMRPLLSYLREVGVVAAPAGQEPTPLAGLLEQYRCWMVQERNLAPARAATYYTLIGLLAASGLRIGEAIKLDQADVDWAQGVLLIRESKFGKSRLVPLHSSTRQALQDYAQLRDRLRPRSNQPSFFVSTRGTRLLYACVCTRARSRGREPSGRLDAREETSVSGCATHVQSTRRRPVASATARALPACQLASSTASRWKQLRYGPKRCGRCLAHGGEHH